MNSASTSGIRDNNKRGTVGDFLQKNVAQDARISVVSAYFTIYAYHELRPQLDNIHSMRFLFGEPRFLKRLDPTKIDRKFFDIEDSGLNLKNRLHQGAIAKACADWIREKVEVRSIIKPGFLHGKLYHIGDGGENPTILGSSNFTSAGLGLTPRPNLELNMVVDSSRDRKDLLAWFDELWEDKKLVEDVKDEVLQYLAQIYENHNPEWIYFKTLYHVFERFVHETGRDSPFEAEKHLYDTGIWNALFEFQKHGVSGLINRIRNHNGAILADAVGLGKTYEALAVIKYFENLNGRVLVLCPKKLRENWTVYQAANNSALNPFVTDRFGYSVLSHTDLSRDGGKVGDLDLQTFNWGAFDLVVIDESHNFRNNARGKRDETGLIVRKTRYARLMDDIIKSGAKTKVLLLSATPVNNDLKDLRNQIYLLTGDDNAAFAESLGIASLKDTLAAAQRAFTDWAGQDNTRHAGALMAKLPSAFFKLMDELTIARSRRHIVRHYQHSLAEIGAFPKRLPPVPIFPEIDSQGEFLSYDALNREISDYRLALFSPFTFVKEEFKPLYEEKQVANFSQTNREKFLVGMMKVNFLKRLESSVASFAITLRRTLDKLEKLDDEIVRFEKLPPAATPPRSLFDSQVEDETDEETQEAFQIGAKGYEFSHFRLSDWKAALQDDWARLHPLWESATAVTPGRDQKLAELKTIIRQKAENPTLNAKGEANRKVLVFTAFADTARYLYENLHQWAEDELDVKSALVVGGGICHTNFGGASFGEILVNFSPRAKQRHKMPGLPQIGEIDLIVATDCISEGQNLQDCDLVVNYDIHWNPVRIIQRFGRIDRIGSQNTAVQLVNFWPTPNLNQYINLKERVEARMALVDVAATTEDNLLSGQNDAGQPLEELIRDDLRYRDKQLLRLKDEILDLEDMNETVSLDEFSLDDFRQELLAYLEANRRDLADAPLGLYAVVPTQIGNPHLAPGVIWCLRRKSQEDAPKSTATAERVNPLDPYFLVYVRDGGEVRLAFPQAKLVLEALRTLCAGYKTPYEDLCALFDYETSNGTDMTFYDDLLHTAAASIAQTFQKRNERQISLLAGRGGTLVDASQAVANTTDFELVTWIILKKAGSSTLPLSSFNGAPTATPTLFDWTS